MKLLKQDLTCFCCTKISQIVINYELDFGRSTPFDIVIMNPPFGTKQSGIDLKFVEKGLEVIECDFFF